MKKLSIFTMLGRLGLKNLVSRLVPALMIVSGFSVLFGAEGARAQPIDGGIGPYSGRLNRKSSCA